MDKFAAKLTAYQGLFGLDNWTIKLQLAQLDDKQHNAMTLADPRYHHANMTIYPRALHNEAEFDQIIIHELIHIVFAMYDYFADNLGKEGTDELFFIAREAGVSAMTAIMMRVLNGGGKTNGHEVKA